MLNRPSSLLSLILFILIFSSHTYPQKVSAELLSSIKPMKLTENEPLLDGVQHIYLKENTLFVSNLWGGLQILDISNVLAPREIGVFKAELTHNAFPLDEKVFLSNELNGVTILDISIPSSPKQVGIIRTKGDAYFVLAKKDVAIVAEETYGIGFYDISDVRNPQEISRFDTDGFAWGLYLQDDILYVADKNGGVVILNISDPGNPQKISEYKKFNYARTIQIIDGLAYVADGPNGFGILDVTIPEKPKEISRFKTDGFTYSVFKLRGSIFLSNERRSRIDIINISDIKNPFKEGEYKASGKVYATVKKDVYLFVAADKETQILRYNNSPVLETIANQTVDENMQLTVTPQASDPDGDPIFFSIENMPDGAKFDSVSGILSWTPTYEQSGKYRKVKITVHEKTTTKLSVSSHFEVDVRHINRNPILPANADSVIDENTKLSFILAQGTDPDKEDKGNLTYRAQNLPEGAVFDPRKRELSWEPTYEQSGSYNIGFTLDDAAGGFANDEITLIVNHVDRKPVLDEVGNKIVGENFELSFYLNGQDLDKEDQNYLSYEASSLPEGSVFNPNTAHFSWTPTFEQSGEYKNLLFVFNAGNLSDSINVDVLVNHTNRRPIIAKIDDKVVDENELLGFSIAGSDLDKEDADGLTYKGLNLPIGAVFNEDSLSFRWKPTFEQSGLYENVQFLVSDPVGLTDTATISITVNHINRAPALEQPLAATVNENAALTLTLAGNDPDIEDKGKLIYTAENLPEGANLQNNTFTWTPTFDQSGKYTVNFEVSDGALSDAKSYEIKVDHVNRAPLISQLKNQETNEKELLSFTLAGSDPDVEDEGRLKFWASDLPKGAAFDSVSNTFNWTPNFDQSGSYEPKFTLIDPNNLKDEISVKVEVNHVNRTPVLPEQPPITIDENKQLEYQLIEASDPDIEDRGKLIYSCDKMPEGMIFNQQNLIISWLPNFESSGDYEILVNVKDSEFTVSKPLVVNVNHINRAPVIEKISPQTAMENSVWEQAVRFNDPDAEDKGKLSLKADNLPGGMNFDDKTGLLNWTPTFEQSGTYDNIKISVIDPAGLVAENNFNLTVTHVNRPPFLEQIQPVTANENESIQIRLAAKDKDKEDEGKLKFSSTSPLPKGAALDAATGAFDWQPTFLQAGAYQLEFQVTDGAGLTAKTTAAITVNDINRAPVLTALEAQSVVEGSELTFNVVGSDEDTDNTLTFSAKELPDGAAFHEADAQFSWKPSFEQAGEYEVGFHLNDGKETVSTSVKIIVENKNREPQLSGDSNAETEEEQELRLSFSASDLDGDNLTFSADNLPSGADFSGDGTFTWTPKIGQAGAYTIIVKVNDGSAEVSENLTINVSAKPAPVPAPADTTSN
jgi:hypothetical protein